MATLRLELVTQPLTYWWMENTKGEGPETGAAGLGDHSFILMFMRCEVGDFELGKLFMMGLHDPCCTARLALHAPSVDGSRNSLVHSTK